MPIALSLDALARYVAVATAMVGLVGGVTSVFKSLFSILRDRSLERRARRHMQAISESLTHLDSFHRLQPTIPHVDLLAYGAQLQDDIHRESHRLAAVRDRQSEREKLKTSEPDGYRRLFLVFLPGGFPGWIIHSLFYGFSFCCLGMSVWEVVSKHYLGALLIVLELGVPAIYFRSAALRRRHLHVLLARTPQNSPGRRLVGWKEWVKLLLLWYPLRMIPKTRIEQLTAQLRAGYYGALMLGGINLYLMISGLFPVVIFLIITMMCSLIAVALASDVLTIQRLNGLNPHLESPESALPAAKKCP